jgi:hypothetical protein
MLSRLSFRSYFATSEPQKHEVLGVPYGIMSKMSVKILDFVVAKISENA